MSSPPPNPWAPIAPWLIAGVALFVLAAAAGLGAAYLATTAQAVPTVDPALLPSATPNASGPAISTSPSNSFASPSPSTLATQAPVASPTSQPSQSAASPTGKPGPSPTPVSYVVKKGDRLTSIAAQFGVSVDAIVQLNNITNPDHIEAGQVLLIPVAP